MSLIHEYGEDKKNEGLKQGLEQGIEQGLEQGLEQGIEQGLEQGIERIILKLLESGDDPELISQKVDMDLSKILEIKNKNNL